MKTVLEIVKLATQHLEKKGIERPRRQAEDLICDALGLDRMQLYMEFDRPMTDAELTLCRERLARRARGEPLQYIHGEVKFLNCRIKVTPAVLIPRQETEILTDKIIQELSKQDLTGRTLWDICCGSGCIGIAIKKHLPNLTVTLSDISSAALELAKANTELNDVDVKFLQGDLLTPFKGHKTDYLVSNPPYVSEEEYPKMDSDVREHEPQLALIAKNKGLDFFERFSKELHTYLNPGGKAWFEIGKEQGAPLLKIFHENRWTHCRYEKDWSGHDRFFFLENQ